MATELVVHRDAATARAAAKSTCLPTIAHIRARLHELRADADELAADMDRLEQGALAAALDARERGEAIPGWAHDIYFGSTMMKLYLHRARVALTTSDHAAFVLDGLGRRPKLKRFRRSRARRKTLPGVRGRARWRGYAEGEV